MNALPYMLPTRQQTHITEAYVSVPPALVVVDEAGNVWTLGTNLQKDAPRGEYAFDVLCNGQATGDFASRIERRDGRVRIFTTAGWKHFRNGTFI